MAIRRIFTKADGDVWIVETDAGRAYAVDVRVKSDPVLTEHSLSPTPDRSLVQTEVWGGRLTRATPIALIGPVAADGSASAQTAHPQTDFVLSAGELSTLAALVQGKLGE